MHKFCKLITNLPIKIQVKPQRLIMRYNFCSMDKNEMYQKVIQEQLSKNELIEAQSSERHIEFILKDEIKGTKHASEFLVIQFTCGVCDTKVQRKFSKKSYEEGVVIIRCEGCEQNHLVADNLGWFEDHPVNIQQLVQRANKPHQTLTIHHPYLAHALNNNTNNT